MIRYIYILISSLFCLATTGQVKLPRLISDNMVLQRDAKLSIWGWAAVGEKVNVKFKDKTYITTTGADSIWMITLPAMKTGGPYEMEITGSNRIVIKNILIGDVWVCSGQSNMELPMERVKEKYAAIIAASTNPNIRQFNVSTTYDFQKSRKDVESGNWQLADPQTVLQFTAVGYFFAKSLYEKYQVPIGLIKAAVGGSPAEAWLNSAALKAFPNHLETALKYRRNGYIDSIRNYDRQVRDNWYKTIWLQDKGLHDAKPWYDTACNVAGWQKMPIPGYWEQHGLKGVNGVVWFRKDIQVPASMTGKPVQLLLGRIVDQDSVFVNGRFAGTTGYQYPPRRYELPAGLLQPGKNTIVVRVINNSGRGGFVTEKPYQLIAGEETIDLTGDWQFALGTTASPLPSQTFFQYQPTGLFNAMISPLLNYRIKGVIWYQGESNAGKPVEYRTLFPAVINTWRQQWNQGNFPFLFVQLANYMAAKEQPGESSWAMTREAQLKTLSLPNTGMAVITDIGEWNDIHPLNKADVGKRLALWAQKQAYGDQKVVYSGPLYQSKTKQGNKLVLQFTNTGSGLMAKGNNELKYFAIAGADKKFVWAKAVIEGKKVVVWSEQVPDPVAVRYAWADNPEGANLYNKEGLPASSFRTDDW
ncbi:sialate O-acetylesterase [Niastella caeni]|uniref:Sialate O-acetylesterase n=1 Tax=Niastella caeni TaxID=2569763 RepID=A0A4S8HLE8_9BACT|nr:sialate O-acetylesterase [Niastella caeni]THU36037.1 sialate O-acetylesterase [Niastella caeni]